MRRFQRDGFVAVIMGLTTKSIGIALARLDSHHNKLPLEFQLFPSLSTELVPTPTSISVFSFRSGSQDFSKGRPVANSMISKVVDMTGQGGGHDMWSTLAVW